MQANSANMCIFLLLPIIFGRYSVRPSIHRICRCYKIGSCVRCQTLPSIQLQKPCGILPLYSYPPQLIWIWSKYSRKCWPIMIQYVIRSHIRSWSDKHRPHNSQQHRVMRQCYNAIRHAVIAMQIVNICCLLSPAVTSINDWMQRKNPHSAIYLRNSMSPTSPICWMLYRILLLYTIIE